MTEPTTPNIGLIVPNTGDLVGAWGTAALNVNYSALDGMLGGVASISLSSATTIVLSTSGASLTPSAGPTQSSNAAIVLSGTLTGNAILQFTQPGHYAIINNCVAGAHYVQLAPSAGIGSAVGVPPGEFWRAFYDGTNMYLFGLPHVGTYLDLAVSATPAWMNAFTRAPYLLCNGQTQSSSLFQALNAYLGSTYGGDGITQFGVPDLQNRYRIPIDFGGNNRITNAGSGIDGTSFGAAGGSQALQSHNHDNSLSDPGHTHTPTGGATIPGAQTGQYANGGFSGQASAGGGTLSTNTTGITISNATAGSGSSGNIPPGIVAGMTFIKT